MPTNVLSASFLNNPASALLSGGGGGAYEGYVNDPRAYGRVPQIPPTTTNLSTVSEIPQLFDYDALSKQASGLAGSMMAGNLPPDVLRNIATAAAERGIATGSPGSPNANAAYLRALGLDTLQMQQQGLTDYNQLLQTAPKTTQTQQDISNNVLQALYAAAPDPMSAKLAELGAIEMGQRAGAGAAGGGAEATPSDPEAADLG